MFNRVGGEADSGFFKFKDDESMSKLSDLVINGGGAVHGVQHKIYLVYRYHSWVDLMPDLTAQFLD
jgi:hypothetical protein